MSHSGSTTTTNGGTLEDCHTNIFVLTELNGLKWCRFTSQVSSQVCTEVQEDPVLCAYGRCLAQSVLSVWRRVPPQTVPMYNSRVDLRLATEKELWVFWYGDEPDWKILGTTALTRDDEGSWEKGVEYDTRSLLFKALHNLIERCLLSREFVRLGRWFVKPLAFEESTSECSQTNQVLAFSFTFFVHGENNVCVCVNVQWQPAVFRLTRDFLNSLTSSSASSSGATNNNNRRTVILAPWSLKGVLNVEDIKSDNDSQTRRREISYEWSKFYPMPPETDNVENMGYVDPVEKERQEQFKANAVPRMVDVMVGGVRLHYPSCFVVLPCNAFEGKTSDKCRLNSSRSENASTAMERNVVSIESAIFDSTKFQKRIVERTEEELTLSRKKSQPPSATSASTADGVPTPPATDEGKVWDFVSDANNQNVGAGMAPKDSCHCSSQQSTTSVNSPIVPNKAQLKVGLGVCGARQRMEQRQVKPSKCGVFHRRTLFNNPTRIVPNLAASEMRPISESGVVAAQAAVTTEVASPMLNSGIEAISRPASRTLAIPSSSSIQMISPAPTSSNCQDTSSHKPPLLAHLEQTLGFASSSTGMSSSDQLELQSSDGSNILIFKRPDFFKSKRRLLLKSSFKPTKKLKTYDGVDFRTLTSSQTTNNDNVDCSVLYKPDIYIPAEEEDFVGQQFRKLQLLAPQCEDNLCYQAEFSNGSFENFNQTSTMNGLQTKAKHDGEPSPSEFDNGSSLNNMGIMKELKSMCESLEPVSSVSETEIADSPTKSIHFNGGVDHPTYLPLTTHDFAPSVSLPDNIMADSSSSSSDNEDDNCHFLSPPPSHGQEEEGSLRKTMAATSTSLFSVGSTYPGACIVQTNQNQTKSGGQNTSSAMDFGIIYPTPPSVDGMTQFSPEAPPTWHDAAHSHSMISSVNYFSENSLQKFVDGPAARVDMKIENKYGKISERPVSAKYLEAGKFGPCTKFASPSYLRRNLNVYRPRLPLTCSVSSQPYPLHLTSHLSVGNVARMPPVIAQPLPPPPYPGTNRSLSYSGPQAQQPPPQHQWSSPPPVRPFEQSPLITNSPMNSSMVRTPRTPAMTDLQSPMSNTSSQYGRNIGSIDVSSSIYIGQSPEAHSLVLSLLLCDTFLDLHKDMIFDACPLCVCSMNIQGSEMGLYVPSSVIANFGESHNQWQQVAKCSCGFSAARHRYLSYKSGLFYEDEYDSTGVWRNRMPASNSDDSQISHEVLELVRYQSLTVDLTRSLCLFDSFERRKNFNVSQQQRYNVHDLQLNDFAELCNIAMEQACLVVDCTTPTREEMIRAKGSLVHSWGFLTSQKPVGNSESMAVMKNLLSVLQESVQKPRGVWQAKHSVEGPLTWRQFHRKCFHRVGVAGRDDFSGPEPVPLLLASNDREWVTLSPFSLRLWDRLSLEPYGQPKDVVYIAVMPDNPLIQSKARGFFRELSKIYEGLRLGRHCPITGVFKDGIMRVGKTFASKLSNKNTTDPWFDSFDSSTSSSSKTVMASRYKLYAQVCRYYLAVHLQDHNVFDRSILRDMGKENQNVSSNDSAMPPPAAPSPSDPSVEALGSNESGSLADPDAENSPIPHVVVVYLVNPFTYGPETEDEEQNRLSSTALFRCYLEIFKDLPDTLKGSIQLQIVPLQTILEFSIPSERDAFVDVTIDAPVHPRNPMSQADYFRQLAFNVFAQSRSVGLSCLLSLQSKPLTGFGPAASRIEMIKKKLEKAPNTAYQVYCPPVILAPMFEHTSAPICSAANDNREDNVRVLFLSYCLTDKQRWLLASASDHQGALLENCVINMSVPNRWCAARRTVIWEALKKLWNFACGLMSTGCQPWRVVIGRLGRIGHEELKVWAHLLNKSQLRSTSRLLRENCACLQIQNIHETPSVMSACLVSTEADSHFRVYSDSFTFDERFGQGGKQCPLSTPEDVSCTHIMVFPTSALIQMSQTGAMSSSGVGQMDDDDFFVPGGWDIPEGDDEMLKLLSDGNFADTSVGTLQNRITEVPDDSIQQQPLALGYTVSTAPIDVTPDWFWSDCPSSRFISPVHLRSSLHINTSGVQQSDDQFLTAGAKGGAASHGHPLDSSLTTDVLRYVLETYNALSWLSLEPTTGDRRSCMPIHMQALNRLYKSIEKLL